MAASAEQVDVDVARAVWEAGDPVIDVRLESEYASGHVAGALNVPVALLVARAAELPAGQLLVVCTFGQRSWRAAQLLALAGRETICLRGGTKAWQAAGLPVLTGPAPGRRRRRLRGRLRRS